ncbi:electron transfer flavoprotein subunit alpha/FixB family protein [Gordonibacter sp.]|uniref:electron transfer flavoprotein subunit alpha/FixB family protein n=1 Tax=Gordonibacter sp. TaxID=1968902 RepID=UPI002FC75907
MKALVLAETSDAARALCAGARQYADAVVFAAIGDSEVPNGIADEVVRIALPEGVVYDDAADTVISYCDTVAPDLVFCEPTRRLKTIAGKLASHAHTAVVTDVIAFDGDVARSLYFGGIGQRTLKARNLMVCTVAPSHFAERQASGANASVEFAWVAPRVPLVRVSSEPIEKTGVDLTKADVVVAAGRGFTSEAELDLARKLCDKLDAGFGCTRPLTEGVDLLPRELYIGVTGLTVTPKVYLACGISGQMQHMVGCNRSGTIFAINKDANAAVFKQCDYGLVGDVATVLPALVAAL